MSLVSVSATDSGTWGTHKMIYCMAYFNNKVSMDFALCPLPFAPYSHQTVNIPHVCGNCAAAAAISSSVRNRHWCFLPSLTV